MRRMPSRGIPVYAWILILGLTKFSNGGVLVSVSNMSGMQGAAVDIPILPTGLNISDSLVAYQMKVRFDPAMLQPLEASQSGTMTAAWGTPFFGFKNDTVRIGGYTTNQPGKRLVLDDGILVKLRFLVLGSSGNHTVLNIPEVQFFNPSGQIPISGTEAGTFTIQDTPAKDVDITLYSGWNLISFPVIPSNSSLPQLLGGLPVTFIFGYYLGVGPKTWDAARPAFLNDLTYLDGFHGYWMKLNSASARVLRITGAPISTTTGISMGTGWNLIGYLPGSSDLVSHSLQSIDPHYLFIMSYQASTGSPKTWDRSRPSFLNDLVALSPLFGYWIKMDNSMSLVYPSSGYVLPKMSDRAFSADAGSFSHAGIPEYCDFWANQQNLFNIGDTIRAFDSKGNACGTALVKKQGMFLIYVPGDDPSTPEDEGATEGEILHFKVNRDSTIVIGTSVLLDSVIVAGKPATWEPKGSKRIELKKATGTAVLVNQKSDASVFPENPVMLRNYPNPFNSSTTIDYRLNREGELTLCIYDVHGRLIRTAIGRKLHQAGSYRFLWDGMDNQGKTIASGIYICRIEAGDLRASTKMILLY